MLERSLSSSRYLAVITIAVSMIAAVSLYVIAAMSVFTTIVDSVRAGPWLPGVAKDAVVGFLDAIDKLLVATGMQIIGLGTYKVFLGGNLNVPAELQVSSFTEMKRSVVKLIGVVLMIFFLEQAVKLGPSEAILYLGLAIAAVIAAFGWAIWAFSQVAQHEK
ncbi:MAG: YqhA family protein [Candidatus Methylomirabilales bacterium]